MLRRLNIAGWVTLSRLLLLPVSLLPACLPWRFGLFVAAVFCALAGLTDILDGHLARRNGCTPSLGSSLDLLTDKLFISTMMVFLALRGTIPYWVPCVVILRE